MNRLCGTRAYLAGAIDRDNDFGKAWRDEMGDWLTKHGVVTFNPLAKPIELGIENTENILERREWKKNGEYDRVSKHMDSVRRVDLRMVDISDFLIVNIDVSVHACGTYEEVTWANRCKKPIIVHCEQGKHHMPDWMFDVIPHELMFSNWAEVKTYLNGVDSGMDTRHFKRWMFFDLAKPTLFSLLMAAEYDDELKEMLENWVLDNNPNIRHL